MTAEKAPKSSLCCSSRMALALIGCVGFVNLYAQRVNMSVALVCMLNHTAAEQQRELVNEGDVSTLNKTEHTNLSDTCSSSVGLFGAAKSSRDDGPYTWSKNEQGIVLGSFFWGYLLTQVPGGMLAERFGGKRVFLYSMVIAAVATALLPLGASVHVVCFIALRILIGLCGGVVFPSTHTLFAKWAPPLERSILVGVAYGGCQLGNVITFPVAGLLCAYVGWESIFYVVGAFGILWCIAWYLMVSDSPEEHRRISRRELMYIQRNLVGQKETKADAAKHYVPWGTILTSMPVWAIIVSHTCSNFGTYLLLTTLPTYMKQALRFDIKSNGLLSSIPYIAFWLCIHLAIFSCDYIRAKGWLSTRTVRKIYVCIASFGQALFLILAGHCECGQEILAVVFITIAQAFSAGQYAGRTSNHIDIAPRYAGTLFGLSNTSATVSGIVAPYIASALTPDGSIAQWRTVFWVAGAVLAFGAIFFSIFAAGELQPWAEVRSVESTNLERGSSSPNEQMQSLTAGTEDG